MKLVIFEGRNVAVEYLWAEGRYDRFPELAAELVRRQVSVIVTSGNPVATNAAKAATSVIPIVFAVGSDPVKLGFVSNLARPDGNMTGVNFFVTELAAKRLGLLRELLPATRIAVLINPANPTTALSTVNDVQAAADGIGLQVHVVNASTIREIDAAFASLVRERTDALLVAGDGFFNSRRVQLAMLAVRHSIPATFSTREYAEAGGLMSYGTSWADTGATSWHLRGSHPQGRQTGRSTGRAVDQVAFVIPPHSKDARPRECRRRFSPAPTR